MTKPIVAELGRAETPQETADRKAAASKVYRSSQTVRNLIAALLVTLAVVAIIVFGVPRGVPTAKPGVDMVGIAKNVESSLERPVLVPELDDFWRVNAAKLQGGAITVWDITLAPASDDQRGFVNIAQAFDADVTWAPQRLNGIAPTDTTVIDGRTWDTYTVRDPGANANISYALGTQVDGDYILLYGSLTPEVTADLAKTLSPQIDELTETR